MDIAVEDAGLDGCADRDDFVGVDVGIDGDIEVLLNAFANEWHARHTADEDDLCDIFSGELCVVEGLLSDWDSFFDDIACEVFEFGSRDSARHVEWGAVFNREEGEVDFGFASDA